MTKPFNQLHEFTQQFTMEALRPTIMYAAENLHVDVLTELRDMLISGAKGCIDAEIDRRAKGEIEAAGEGKPKLEVVKTPKIWTPQ